MGYQESCSVLWLYIFIKCALGYTQTDLCHRGILEGKVSHLAESISMSFCEDVELERYISRSLLHYREQS